VFSNSSAPSGMEVKKVDKNVINNAVIIKAEKGEKSEIIFYYHLAVYLAVNTIFFLIIQVVSPGELWSLFLVTGWGICLIGHFLSTIPFSVLSKEKIIQKKMKKLSLKGKQVKFSKKLYLVSGIFFNK